MKKLLCYLKGYRVESVLGPLFKFAEAALELLVPLVVAAIIDRGVTFADKNYVTSRCLLLVLLGFVGLLFSVTAQFFAAKASCGFVTKLRSALFSHIQHLPQSEMDRVGASTLLTRITSDMNQVQTGTNLTLRLLLRSPFVVFGAMVMAFTIDFSSALVFAGAIPVLFAVVFAVMLSCIPLYKKVQSKLDRTLSLTRENLTGARPLRAFRKEKEEIQNFDTASASLFSEQLFVGRVSALLNPLTFVIINIGVMILLWVGAIRVDSGVLSRGEVVALYNYMSQILVELIKFASLVISITKSIASGNRIQKILELPVEEEQGKGAAPEEKCELAVSFSHVGFSYHDSAEKSLSDISFSVKKGEFIGVIGSTGSGKTTLVNLLPRFYDKTEGEILLFGKRIEQYSLSGLRSMIAVVPQKARLFRGSIRENMQWGNLNATDEEIWSALEQAQAKAVCEEKGGLDFLIEQNGRNLSGGQKQRFTIARALVKKPKILILDDSSSALDFATEAALRASVRNLGGKTTVFWVSQRIASVQFADRILCLEDGELVGVGSHDELLKTCPVYREIVHSQTQEGGEEE